jgi:hypothetical protein
MMERKVDEREEEAYTDSNKTMNKIIADGKHDAEGCGWPLYRQPQ